MGIAGDEIVGNGGAAPFVRQVSENDPGPLGEGLGIVMIVAANADAGITHFAGICLGIGDEPGKGFGREVLGRGAEHDWNLAQPCHQDHFLLVVDLEFLLVDDGCEHVCAGVADLQRVAVRL